MGGSVQVLGLAKSKFGRDRVLCRTGKPPGPARQASGGHFGERKRD